MSTASLYVSAPVVDRLTKGAPTTQSLDDLGQHFDTSGVVGDRHVMDVASFMGALHGSSTPGRTSRGRSTSRERASSRERGTSRSGVKKAEHLTEEETMERVQQFSQFLGRQDQVIKRKERKLKEVLPI